jgi:shikimate dehydrogenase
MSEAKKPRTAGVIGWPVGHSLSPLIHRYWAEKEGIDAVYLPLLVEPGADNLRRAVLSLAAAGFKGFNVTIPHKEAALKIADEASATAAEAGAANMLSVRNDRLYADNSDVEGFRAALEGALRPGERPSRALVLGAGGAARAAIIALQGLGVGDLLVVNRSVEKTKALASAFGVCVGDWRKRSVLLRDRDVVVHATSLGMKGEPPLEIALDGLKDDAIVAEVVYAPLETELLKAARRRGLRTTDGLSMLIGQAAPAYRAWLGSKADADAALRRLLERALDARNPS